MFGWIGSRLVRGFLILLPVILSYLLFGSLFDLIMALTIPITDVLPESVVADAGLHRFLALGILVGLCLFSGIAADTDLAQRFGDWVETRALKRFAPYGILKSLAQRLSGRDTPDKLEPAFLVSTPDTRMLAFVVERHDDGKLTLFVPLGSTPGVGQIQVVEPEKVERLDASMMEALGCLFNWGQGAETLMRSRRQG